MRFFDVFFSLQCSSIALELCLTPYFPVMPTVDSYECDFVFKDDRILFDANYNFSYNYFVKLLMRFH